MLTVDEIKNISFKKARIGGYSCDDVDEFIEKAADTVEELKKQYAEILAKSELLIKKVDEYKQDEDSVHQVMLKAEKEAAKTKKDAQEEAQKIVDDAKAEADRIIADANDRIIREKEMIVKIEQESANIRDKLIEAYEKQIEALRHIPDHEAVERKQRDLDERYPTGVYSDKADEAAPIVEEVFSTIEEAAEDAKADTSTAAAAAVEAETETDSETIQIEKSAFEKKFGKLKFGDDYDVKSET